MIAPRLMNKCSFYPMLMIRRVLNVILLACFACAPMVAQQTEFLNLSGQDGDDAVAWDFFCSKGMNSGRWSKVRVPSCWELQGFGEYTYGRYYKKANGRASDEVGTYRRRFLAPLAWRGKKIDLVFEGVMTDASVSVNGKSAGPTHQGGFTSFYYDITSLLRIGKENTLEVVVSKQSADKSVNDAERRADWWLFGGIYRPVYLRIRPSVSIKQVSIDAKADGTLSLSLRMEGLSKGCMLRTSVGNLGTKTIHLSRQAHQTVTTAWEGVKAWNPEQPHLYALTLQLVSPHGNVLHEVGYKIGFRTIEFRRRDGFYLNGTKLLIKGVNRHCAYPETGRTTSRRLDLQDIKLIKGMNANAIRSHYPPDRHLLELCDSLGVLYFDELPGWQNSYSTAVGTRILREMLESQANHPCIFAWGNGNEGGFNLALDPLFAQYDLQRRHVVHPWAMFDGVDAHHYPAYQTGVARLGNGYNVFMPTEFLHSQYDKGGGASLSDYWASWSGSPLFAGGFIWAFADEGIVRTDQGGVIDTDGGNAPDGIVGPHREKEGSWYTIRSVWAPVKIRPLAVRPGWDGRMVVHNEYLFTRLKEIDMTYRILRLPAPFSAELTDAVEVAKGRVLLPDVAPGCSGEAQVELANDAAHGGDVLQVVARNKQGDTINVWTWPMRYADEYWAAYHPMRKENALQAAVAAKAEGTALCAQGGVKAVFSEATGMLTSVSYGGREVPFCNGPLPVGMQAHLKTIKSRQEGGDALFVMHYVGAVDSIVWRMRPDGLLGMDAVLLNRRDGGQFGSDFFDKEVDNLGFSFSYPEEEAKAMRWMGRGPYRVWRNRQEGAEYGIWQKDYNNTVTGESQGRLVYPEFKGYHANMYWAQIYSDTAPFTVYSETDGLYFRLFTPEEPKHLNNGEPTMRPFPKGDISFLLEIPGMRSYKPIGQLGPQAQPGQIRINKGDDGLRIKLWFDFSGRLFGADKHFGSEETK